MALFELGKVSITELAEHTLRDSGETADSFLARHQEGDWGDVSEETVQSNMAALAEGLRLESIYHTARGDKLLIVTEPDRALTSIMLPEEF